VSKATTIFLKSSQSCGRGLWRCSVPQQRAIFELVREARAFVIVSAQNLCYRPLIGPDAQQQRTRMECDIWEGMAEAYIDVPHANRVDIRLQQFVIQIEQLCRPIIDRSYALNG
jgi:hypothetical protein